ncbi:MAG: helix-turn-helix domain-containing protein [Magnetococcales bacterium]|nr:helix-turn-helix domain-containing protein [Magnetococcales bacterium]
MKSNEHLAKRVKEARSRAGLKQVELAQEAGISSATVQKLESGESGGSIRTLNGIANACGVDAAWLSSGSESNAPYTSPENASVLRIAVTNVENIVNWQDWADWTMPPTTTEWIRISVPKDAGSVVALTINNDIMSPELIEGDKAIVALGKKPKHGQIVVAYKTGSKRAFLRQIMLDSATTFLKPTNNRYPIKPINSEYKVIGVVVSKYQEYN